MANVQDILASLPEDRKEIMEKLIAVFDKQNRFLLRVWLRKRIALIFTIWVFILIQHSWIGF